MITKYFATVTVKFNPFVASGRSARLFLSRVPSTSKINCKVLTNNTTEVPLIEVTFKDKHVMKADPETMNISDLANYFNTHSRKLAIQDAIKD